MLERPPRDLEVPPAAVRGSGRRRGGAAVAVAIVGGAIAAAVVAAQLTPAPGPRPAPAAPSLPAPSTASPGGPVAGRSSRPAVVIPRRLGRAELASAVHDGSLDGRLVFVDGSLDVAPRRCQGLAEGDRGCVDLAIPGVGLPVWAGAVALPLPGPPPPGAWLVTVARAGGLVYLGSLVPWLDGPRTVDELRRLAGDGDGGHAPGGRAAPGGTLFEADGYLVVNPVHACVTRGAGATPCPAPPPLLADDRPLDGGILVSDAGAEVRLAGAVPEVDPADTVTPGTFLVAPGADAAAPWTVVARYDPARAVRVQVP